MNTATRPDHDKICPTCGYANHRVRIICKDCRQPLDRQLTPGQPPLIRPQRYSPWPLVRRVLIPVWFAVIFGGLVARALQVPGAEMAVAVLVGGGLPILGGYLARRGGATYGGALNTMWVTTWVGLAMAVPLGLLAYVTGVQTASPQLTEAWTTLRQQGPGPIGLWLLAIPLVGVVMLLSAVVMWLCWLPFTLLGAWIGAPD